MVDSKLEIPEKMDKKPVEKLTKFIRLAIYKYIDFETTLKIISRLCKNERISLKNAAIAYEGKSQTFKLNNLLID